MARGRVFVLGVLVGAGVGMPPRPAAAVQQVPSTLEAWKESLQKTAGGAWMTSNAAYREEDQGPVRYGLEFTVQPGGVSATGCLWAELEDGTEQIAWRFFQAWDPSRQAPFVYQSHGSGGFGMGYLADQGPEVPGIIQDFWWPDGSTERTGHTEEWQGPDRRVSRSLDFADGRWVPRRTYTWVRDRQRESPC